MVPGLRVDNVEIHLDAAIDEWFDEHPSDIGSLRDQESHALPDSGSQGPSPVRGFILDQSIDFEVFSDDNWTYHAHNQRVRFTILQQVIDGELKGGIAAFMESDGRAVEIDAREVVNGVEL